MSEHALFQDIIRKRRSVRKFEPGRNVGRDVLQRIIDCGRWAPSGANVQCWDFIVVDDPAVRDKVMAVFLRQAQRLVDHAKGFPAVKKTYLAQHDRDRLRPWRSALEGLLPPSHHRGMGCRVSREQ